MIKATPRRTNLQAGSGERITQRGGIMRYHQVSMHTEFKSGHRRLVGFF